jgi:hypothetical protein
MTHRPVLDIDRRIMVAVLVDDFIACLTLFILILINSSTSHTSTPAQISFSLAYPKTMKLFFNKP